MHCLDNAPPTAPLPVPEPGRAAMHRGAIRQDLNSGARLRLRPTRQCPVLTVIPPSCEVTLVDTPAGEAVERGKTDWYSVRWCGRQGHIYAGLIKLINMRI